MRVRLMQQVTAAIIMIGLMTIIMIAPLLLALCCFCTDDFDAVLTLCRELVHATDANGDSPMHRAAAVGNSLLIACLARIGCSVAAQSRDGCSPLALAVRRGDADSVKACMCGTDAKLAAFVVDNGSGR